MADTMKRLPLYQTLLFVACVILLLVDCVSLQDNLRSLKQSNVLMERSLTSVAGLQYLNVLIMDAESSTRGYFISGNDIYLGPLKTANSEIEGQFAALTNLLQDNPAQLKNLLALKSQINRKLKLLNQALLIYQQGGLADIVKIAKMGEARETMDEIRLSVVILAREESTLQVTRSTRLYDAYRKAIGVGIGINALAILILLIFYCLIRRSFFARLTIEDALKNINENLEATVLARTDQLAVLSRHLLNVAELEKEKLARELHDELGASLTVINMDVAAVIEKLKNTEPVLAAQLQRARKTLLETIDLKRHIIENLRPSTLDNLGLPASIRNYCENFSKVTGIACNIDIEEALHDVDSMQAIALYRILQEALTNITKYAHAKCVDVILKNEANGLSLEIADDGIGISLAATQKPKSHGLLGMRERALLLGGSLTIGGGIRSKAGEIGESGKGARGASIKAFIPVAR
jgi:signal transduction histidine kinase